jgi:hypothetical protein
MIAIFKKSLALLLLMGATTGYRLNERKSEETHPERKTTSYSPINPVDLGTAGDFAILAKTGISTVPASVITGNIGVSPIAATAMTGFSLTLENKEQYSTSGQVTGNCYAETYADPTPANMALAVSDMETAYLSAEGTANSDDNKKELGGGLLGGLTLEPGVYTFTTDISISTDVTLNGPDNAVFLIQTTGSVTQAAAAKVILTGGVLAKNVFWQVAGQVEVGATAVMQGIILAKTGVAFGNASTLNGSVLTQTACTLDMATITKQ